MNSPFPPSRDGALGFVIAVWAWLTVLNLAYVSLFGLNFPFADDLVFLPVLSGSQPLSFGWLWEPLNEHRFFLARFAAWAMARAFDNDLRFTFLLNAALSSATGLMLLLSIRRERGFSRLLDIACPIFAMSWMHWWNFLSGVGLIFAIFQFAVAGLICGVLLQFWNSARRSLLSGLCMISLPLNGGMGLVAAFPVTLFFYYCAGVQWRSRNPGARFRAFVLLASALASSAVIGVYLASGPVRVDLYPDPQSVSDVALTFLRVSSLPLGPWVYDAWENARAAMAIGMTLWIAAMGSLLTVSIWRERGFRMRSIGLGAVLAGIMGVAGVIGYARGALGGNAGMAFWYVTMVSMAPVAIYCLAIQLQVPIMRRSINTALLVGACLAAVTGFHYGAINGRVRRDGVLQVIRCIRAGYDPEVIAERYTGVFRTLTPSALVGAIRHLEQWHQGPFDLERPSFPGEPPMLEFYRLGFTSWSGKEARVEPAEGGRVQILGRSAYVESLDETTAFTFPKVPALGAAPVIVRLELQSSTDTVVRLISIPSPSNPEGVRVERTSDCRVGTSMLTFYFSDGEYEDREWLFIPGAEGRYRLQTLSVLELPAQGRFDPGRAPGRR